jgi:hypothetical protein
LAYVIAGVVIMSSDISLLAAIGQGTSPGNVSLVNSLEIIGPVLIIILIPASLLTVAFATWRGCSWARYFGIGAAASLTVIASTGKLPWWVIPVAVGGLAYLNLPRVKLQFSQSDLPTQSSACCE